MADDDRVTGDGDVSNEGGGEDGDRRGGGGGLHRMPALQRLPSDDKDMIPSDNGLDNNNSSNNNNNNNIINNNNNNNKHNSSSSSIKSGREVVVTDASNEESNHHVKDGTTAASPSTTGREGLSAEKPAVVAGSKTVNLALARDPPPPNPPPTHGGDLQRIEEKVGDVNRLGGGIGGEIKMRRPHAEDHDNDFPDDHSNGESPVGNGSRSPTRHRQI